MIIPVTTNQDAILAGGELITKAFLIFFLPYKKYTKTYMIVNTVRNAIPLFANHLNGLPG